jgi:cytochrome P450
LKAMVENGVMQRLSRTDAHLPYLENLYSKNNVLLLNDGERRDELIAHMSSGFTRKALKSYYPVIQEMIKSHCEIMRSTPGEIQLYSCIQSSALQVMQRLVLGHRPTHERFRLVTVYSQAHFRGIAAATLPIKIGNNKLRFNAAVSSKEPLLRLISQAIAEVLSGVQDDRASIMKEWIFHAQGKHFCENFKLPVLQ